MRVKRLTETAKLPTKAHTNDLGFDLYADESIAVPPGYMTKIAIGIAIEFPEGFGGIIKDRSSLASSGLLTAGGVIDGGYRGEIIIIFHNVNKASTFFIGKGQKIAQLILIPIYNIEVEETTEPLLQTIRGGKGFGSTGS